MSHRKQDLAWTAAAAVLLLAGCSGRGEWTASPQPGSQPTPRVSAAQRIELPGAVEGDAAAPLAAAQPRRMLPETPEVIRLPDGTVGVKVAAQYYDTIVACRQSDGRYGTDCPSARKRQP